MGSHDTCHLMGSNDCTGTHGLSRRSLRKLWVPMESHEVAWYLPWEPMASACHPRSITGAMAIPMVYIPMGANGTPHGLGRLKHGGPGSCYSWF